MFIFKSFEINVNDVENTPFIGLAEALSQQTNANARLTVRWWYSPFVFHVMA